jgi:uncharacterized protein YijF (DUF1287 family)
MLSWRQGEDKVQGLQLLGYLPRNRVLGKPTWWPAILIFLACAGMLLLLAANGDAHPLVDLARTQIGVTTSYDPGYRKLTYPGGDVPLETGVCSDVLVRAFRGLKLDLQKAVHEDMTRAFGAYPQKWGRHCPDPNIDHRRVLNLMTYFKRRGWSIPIGKTASDFWPGDIVAWNLGGGLTHIGIISDQRSPSGTPLAIHNIGRGAREEDILFQYQIIGHYRPGKDLLDGRPGR